MQPSSGMNLLQIMFSLKSYWQIKAVTLNLNWWKSCGNWLTYAKWTMPYHPKTNGQCEKFNQTLINMIGMLESNEKQHWKDYLHTLVHAYNCTKNNAIDLSLYYLMYGHKPRFPIDIKFGLTSPKTEEHSHNEFVAKLSTQLQKCYKLANRHQCKESTHDKHQYDLRWEHLGSNLETSD